MTTKCRFKPGDKVIFHPDYFKPMQAEVLSIWDDGRYELKIPANPQIPGECWAVASENALERQPDTSEAKCWAVADEDRLKLEEDEDSSD